MMHCTTEGCDGCALFVVHWPRLSGPPPEMCLPCTLRALALAEHMGFALSITPHPTLVPIPPAPRHARWQGCVWRHCPECDALTYVVDVVRLRLSWRGARHRSVSCSGKAERVYRWRDRFRLPPGVDGGPGTGLVAFHRNPERP